MRNVTFVFSSMGPIRKFPAGTSTTPPWSWWHASMADWMARVSRVTPSPAAPKSRTLKIFAPPDDVPPPAGSSARAGTTFAPRTAAMAGVTPSQRRRENGWDGIMRSDAQFYGFFLRVIGKGDRFFRLGKIAAVDRDVVVLSPFDMREHGRRRQQSRGAQVNVFGIDEPHGRFGFGVGLDVQAGDRGVLDAVENDGGTEIRRRHFKTDIVEGEPAHLPGVQAVRREHARGIIFA